jgi:uncharacterized protein (TIGR00255 family)
MTGFARSAGVCVPYRWNWELKTVNAKGLDLRLRVPPGFAAIEAAARQRLGRELTRGTVFATLTIQRDSAIPQIQINQPALDALIDAAGQAAEAAASRGVELRAPSLDGLLAVRGIVEIIDGNDSDEILERIGAAALAGLDAAIAALVGMRKSEGAALTAILAARLDAIARLTEAAETAPGRGAEAIRERLGRSLATLAKAGSTLDQTRLYQEALLIAANADIREELDRLVAHIAAARVLVSGDQPAGRRLDFLSQELGREANTLCAKSNDTALTNIGLELRVEIEQFREQVANIE